MYYHFVSAFYESMRYYSYFSKDELLRNYERDLAKLRQAELLVAKKSEQVEELVVGVPDFKDLVLVSAFCLDSMYLCIVIKFIYNNYIKNI